MPASYSIHLPHSSSPAAIDAAQRCQTDSPLPWAVQACTSAHACRRQPRPATVHLPRRTISRWESKESKERTYNTWKHNRRPCFFTHLCRAVGRRPRQACSVRQNQASAHTSKHLCLLLDGRVWSQSDTSRGKYVQTCTTSYSYVVSLLCCKWGEGTGKI